MLVSYDFMDTHVIYPWVPVYYCTISKYLHNKFLCASNVGEHDSLAQLSLDFGTYVLLSWATLYSVETA